MNGRNLKLRAIITVPNPSLIYIPSNNLQSQHIIVYIKRIKKMIVLQ